MSVQRLFLDSNQVGYGLIGFDVSGLRLSTLKLPNRLHITDKGINNIQGNWNQICLIIKEKIVMINNISYIAHLLNEMM